MSSSLANGSIPANASSNTSSIIRATPNNPLISYFIDTKIGVVTALQSELDALKKIAIRHEAVVGEKRTYNKLYFEINGINFAIVAYTLNRMGICPMTITLMEILHIFPNLKYLGLIGIAAGSNSKTQNKGDILIPSGVCNYEMGKYSELKNGENPETSEIKFESDHISFPIDEDILQKITTITNNKNILGAILNDWNGAKSTQLKVHIGDIACGSAVIASSKKVGHIKEAIPRKYIGIDMESFALATLNQLKHNEHIKMFIIKAISDFADSAKDDTEQEFASFISAKVFLEVCSRVLL